MQTAWLTEIKTDCDTVPCYKMLDFLSGKDGKIIMPALFVFHFM